MDPGFLTGLSAKGVEALVSTQALTRRRRGRIIASEAEPRLQVGVGRIGGLRAWYGGDSTAGRAVSAGAFGRGMGSSLTFGPDLGRGRWEAGRYDVPGEPALRRAAIARFGSGSCQYG